MRSFHMATNSANNITFIFEASSLDPNNIEIVLSTNISNSMTFFILAYDILVYDKTDCIDEQSYYFTSSTKNNVPNKATGGWHFFSDYDPSRVFKYSQWLLDSSTFFGISGYAFQNTYAQAFDFSLYLDSNNIKITTPNYQTANVPFIIFQPVSNCNSTSTYNATVGLC
jgi:hypothetical protein